jgi:hypothetical protein
MGDHERQEIFNFASILIDHAFPTQVRGRQMYDQWETCQMYIQHAQSIASLFAWLERAGHGVLAPEAFAHLMSNCAWYVNILRIAFYFDLGNDSDVLGTCMNVVPNETLFKLSKSPLILARKRKAWYTPTFSIQQ